MKTLFDPVRAGALRLSNRIVMAPLTRNRVPDALPTPLMATYYLQRASAGLFTYVVQQLAPCELAYLHIIEGSTGGPRDHVQGDTAFDYGAPCARPGAMPVATAPGW